MAPGQDTSGLKRRVASFVGALILMAAGAAPASAQANDLPIDAFFGRWLGSGVSQTDQSVLFRYTQRDLNVTISKAGPGFSINWTTIQRKKGDPQDPSAVRKTTSATFVPAGRAKVWRVMGALDPVKGKAYSWARLGEQTLTINSLVIAPDGGYEMQIYQRELSGSGMNLEFRRVKDGSVVRTVKARLSKQAN